MLARSVWFHGGRHRRDLFPGMNRMAADELLDYAVQRQWVSARDDMVVPGTVNPVPRMPVRSSRDRVTSWGPGPGRLW
jgi:predicted oxidoreductase